MRNKMVTKQKNTKKEPVTRFVQVGEKVKGKIKKNESFSIPEFIGKINAGEIRFNVNSYKPWWLSKKVMDKIIKSYQEEVRVSLSTALITRQVENINKIIDNDN